MMIRPLACAASLLFAIAVPGLAQTHTQPPAPPRSHAQPHPPARDHSPGHVRPAAAHQAAVHARLHGNWRGSLQSPRGASSELAVSVAGDSIQGVTLTVSSDRPVRAGRASGVAIEGARLRWTQELSGSSCAATAVVIAATRAAPETLEGTLACDTGELRFTLRKVTG